MVHMDYTVLRADILDSRPDIDIKDIDKAYEFAKAAHEGQKRYSGEDYIMHPVAAAGILLRLHPDLETIQACLLHDVTEDTERTLEEVEREFGGDVAKLVKGAEKLSLVKLKEDDIRAEKWKDMFLAMAKDIRIVFIKLADRLHNMQTLEHVPDHKRERIARESLEVHAAIASRLGIYNLKSEIEDLCFMHLYPEEYKELSEVLYKHRGRSAECMKYATSQVEQLLMREGVKVKQVKGRMKHLWSLRQKMIRYDTDAIEDIYDNFAVRVILPDEGDIYSALGVIHGEFIPLQDRFKDYAAVPKPNGYKSLHTTVVGLGGELYEEPTEIQIRTEQMHKEAELGIASHWTYKLGGKMKKSLDRERHFKLHSALQKVNAENLDIVGVVGDWIEKYQGMMPEDRAKVEKLLLVHGLSEVDLDNIMKGRSQGNLSLHPDVDQQLAWLRGLAEEEKPNADIDLYPDKIFVLTPGRDVVELPRGATPIDFAFAIHTEVGTKMVHAKVNGRIVPLDYELRNGEVVEVGTRRNAKPNRYWLSIAKTSSAKSKIKNWFNKQDYEGNVVAGREMLNKQLAFLGKPALDDKLFALKEYAGQVRTLHEREQILESIGLGTTTAAQVVKTLHPGETSQSKAQKEVDSLSYDELTKKVLVTGEEDLPVVLSSCCKPKPPAAIIGYVARGQTIRVHRQSCRELAGLEGERFVSAHWK